MKMWAGVMHTEPPVSWNPATTQYATLSNNDLTAVGNTASQIAICVSTKPASLKRYCEVTVDAIATSIGLGISNVAQTDKWFWYSNGNQLFHNNTLVANPPTYAVGNIISIAVDSQNSKLYLAVNGVWILGQDPSTGTAGEAIAVDDWYTLFLGIYNGTSCTANFGASPFAYAVPSGFIPWNR